MQKFYRTEIHFLISSASLSVRLVQVICTTITTIIIWPMRETSLPVSLNHHD